LETCCECAAALPTLPSQRIFKSSQTTCPPASELPGSRVSGPSEPLPPDLMSKNLGPSPSVYQQTSARPHRIGAPQILQTCHIIGRAFDSKAPGLYRGFAWTTSDSTILHSAHGAWICREPGWPLIGQTSHGETASLTFFIHRRHAKYRVFTEAHEIQGREINLLTSLGLQNLCTNICCPGRCTGCDGGCHW
jgi:hypothetical protein